MTAEGTSDEVSRRIKTNKAQKKFVLLDTEVRISHGTESSGGLSDGRVDNG